MEEDIKIYYEQPKKIETKLSTQLGPTQGGGNSNILGTTQNDRNKTLNPIKTNPWRRKFKSNGNYPKRFKRNAQLN